MTSDQLAADAATVAHLAVYFDELRRSALELSERRTAASRGYFTPGEDEEVRHLLVSYMRARAALFDVVTSFRADTALPDDLRPAAFVVAYAAALLLIDAARFLREAFGQNAIVRRKLNEAEPRFGVPAGSYDEVQRSLTSPLHAWHIYHARKWFDEHQAELRSLDPDERLASCLAIVVRLASRADVSAARYARARLRARARDAGHGVGRDLFGRAIYGLVKLASSACAEISTRPGHRPSLPAHVRAALAPLLAPGDVLIVRKEHALTNLFLPGYWPHAALYLGTAAGLASLGVDAHEEARPRWVRLLSRPDEEPRRVVEAMKDGVRIRPVDSPFGSDAIVVLRPLVERDALAHALVRALSHEGKPYDFDFDFTRADRMVCTEVVYRSFDGLGDIRFQLTRRAGRLTLAAEDLLNMSLDRAGFATVAAYAPTVADRVLEGAEAESAVRATNCPTKA